MALLLVVPIHFAQADEAPRAPAKKVLFIGIDGCRFDALRASTAKHLEGLIADGCFADDTQILPERPTKSDTISGPGWSSLLTGVWSDKHGVVDNDFKRPKLDDFPHFFRRLKESRPKAYTISVVDWTPIHLKIVRDADVSAALIHPKLAADGKVELDYEQADAKVARRAVRELTDADPTAMFVYFGQVDETGHRHGFHPTVDEYRAAIGRVDQFVGQLLDAVKNRKSYRQEDWLILVSSDHGGKGTGHGGGHNDPEIRNSFLIVSGAAAARGKIEMQTYIVDAPVTALVHLGVKLDPAWQLDGKPVGLAQSK